MKGFIPKASYWSHTDWPRKVVIVQKVLKHMVLNCIVILQGQNQPQVHSTKVKQIFHPQGLLLSADILADKRSDRPKSSLHGASRPIACIAIHP